MNIACNDLFCDTVDCVVAEKDESLVDAFAKRRTLADAKVCCDYALCVSLATWNDRVAEEMELIVRDKGQTLIYA